MSDPATSSTEDAEQNARNIVLRQLANAPKTRHQLGERLAAREIPEDIAEAVLDRFEEVQLIDDAEFAELWVRSRHRSQGLARRALSMELKQRGVDDHHIEAALEQVTDDDERTKAHELVAQRVARSTGPATHVADQKQRDRIVRRLVGFLARKGYAPGLAFSIVTEVLNAEDHDDLNE